MELNLDDLDKIASIIQSFVIALLSFFAFMQFRYRHDDKVRELHSENWNSLTKFGNYINEKKIYIGTGQNEVKNGLIQPLLDAKVYLNKEIVDYLQGIVDDFCELVEKQESNNDFCDDLRLKLIDKIEKRYKIYRKQLVHEPWSDIKDFWKNQWQTSITKSLFKQN